jgi:hypothetical protein
MPQFKYKGTAQHKNIKFGGDNAGYSEVLTSALYCSICSAWIKGTLNQFFLSAIIKLKIWKGRAANQKIKIYDMITL